MDLDFNEFSFKELYSCRLKSTYNLEVAGRTIEVGEVIADFDRIQIANFQEIKSHIAARGGYNNEPQVVWDATQQLNLEFTQGIFSKTQYALMNNLKYLKPVEESKELIGMREELESDEAGEIELRYRPHCDVFIYTIDKDTGWAQKFTWSNLDSSAKYKWIWLGLEIDEGRKIRLEIDGQPVVYKDVIVDYCYQYTGKTQTMLVGKEFTNGFLWLEGKTRVKDDVTGQVKTGVLRIPKLKLMSDLSIRVGAQANPQVGHFRACAYPTGSQGNKEVMRMIFLEDDIDSDM